MDKKCKKCGLTKPLASFPIRAAMRDGHRNECLDCKLAYQQAWVARMRKDPGYVAMDRARHRAKSAERRANGKAKPTNYATVKRWIKRNRHAQRAHWKASKAQMGGVLVKPQACEQCGARRRQLEKHHPDYSKPLEVLWLCSKCHGLTRRKPLPKAA